MSTASPTTSRSRALTFCTRCGTELVGGRCPEHDATQPTAAALPTGAAPVVEAQPLHDAPASPDRSGRWPWLRIAGAIVLVFAVSAAGWVTALGSRREVRSLRDELRRSASALQAAGEESAASTRDLSVRVGSLEAAAKNTADPAALAKHAKPSVFTVETDTGVGSGFVVESGGGKSQLVTNFHVIADVALNGGHEVHIRKGDRTYVASIVKTNAADDLALLSVDVDLPALPVRPAEPAAGDPVLVIGSPLGLGGSVSTGIVSALRTEDGIRYVQFTAPVSPGNSGGPVLDARGRVIGVSVLKAVAPGAEGLSFAVPAARICADFEVC